MVATYVPASTGPQAFRSRPPGSGHGDGLSTLSGQPVGVERGGIPFADTSAYVLPQSVRSEDAVMLADILPISYEVGVLNAGVGPGDTVVIVGAGPIGLAAVTTAKLFSPSAIVVVDPPRSPRCSGCWPAAGSTSPRW